jgi:hypothetical protein
MKMALQVAAGLIVIVLGVYGVINIPRWVVESRKETTEAIIVLITPETLIANCGRPLSDKQEDVAKMRSGLVRSMEFKGIHSTVTAVFYGSDKTAWVFNHVDVGSAERINSWDNQSASRMISELPCVGGPNVR